jgi:hypothetical protein
MVVEVIGSVMKQRGVSGKLGEVGPLSIGDELSAVRCPLK